MAKPQADDWVAMEDVPTQNSSSQTGTTPSTLIQSSSRTTAGGSRNVLFDADNHQQHDASPTASMNQASTDKSLNVAGADSNLYVRRSSKEVTRAGGEADLGATSSINPRLSVNLGSVGHAYPSSGSGRYEPIHSPGTPSHYHPSSGGSFLSQFNFNGMSFPKSSGGADLRPSLADIFKSRAFRSVVLLFAVFMVFTSILHSARPDILPSGFEVLSNHFDFFSSKELQEMRSLDGRLRDLLEKPALEQWEMELPNRHACPFYTYSRNTYFFHDGKENEWHGVSHTDVRKYRNAMVSHLKEVEASGDHLVWTTDYLKERSGGVVKRGIILTGGEGSTLPRMLMLLDMLRNTVGCTLPIELYHFPDELKDSAIRDQFLAFQPLTIHEFGGKHDNGKNWHIKNGAFLQSEFTEFIYMDSDNLPLVDPEVHFDSVEYRQGGSVFWPDLYKDHPDNSIWRVLGRTCSDEHWPAEAGQVVFDKRGNNGLNLAVLHLANHMMMNPDMYGFLSYGDKDTFRFSFYALGLPYQQSPRIFASAGGFQTQGGDTSDDYFCGHSLLQWSTTPWSERKNRHYHPEPAFLHTILAKHRFGLQADRLFSHIRRPRLDNITEPTLVRTLYEFTGDCFALTQKGPDGIEGAENSMRDGQGVITIPFYEAFKGGEANKVYQKVKALQQPFVDINNKKNG